MQPDAQNKVLFIARTGTEEGKSCKASVLPDSQEEHLFHNLLTSFFNELHFN